MKDPNRWNCWGPAKYRKGKRINLAADLDPKKPNKIYWENMVVDLPPLFWHPIVDSKVTIKRDIVSPIPDGYYKGKLRNISRAYRFEVPIDCFHKAIRIN